MTRAAGAHVTAFDGPDVDDVDRTLLRLLTEGHTNAEMATKLELTEEAVGVRLAKLLARASASRTAPRRRRSPSRASRDDGGAAAMTLRVRVDRHKCIGAGNCITIAPTAFDWLRGDLGKAEVLEPDSVDDELLREATFACPTGAIVIDEVSDLLPWQLRGKVAPNRRVLKTFMFTDVVGSTNLVEALGDEAWDTLLRWHDTTLREVFTAHEGREISTTGDGFFVSFDSPEAAVAAAIAIQRRLAEHRQKAGFAPQVRIGLHASDAQQVGDNFRGKGVHEASRIAGLATGGQIIASLSTVGESYRSAGVRSELLKGLSEPMEVVTIDWR